MVDSWLIEVVYSVQDGFKNSSLVCVCSDTMVASP